MASFALSLRERGWWVRGILSTTAWRPSGNVCPAFIDLDSCKSYTQINYQSDSSASELLDAKSELAGHMREIVRDGADLAIFHRFSSSEAAGKGVAAELFLLMTSGIPLLTTIRPEQYDAWRSFTRNQFVLLPPSLESLFSWIEGVWREHHSGLVDHEVWSTQCGV
ncbi:DUF2478 domain-containing protein [Dechloromonas sp. ARDL1]|uniref:DUF2478 domain-containing protein n=1 Tax=Dechloromonas sp. ARDL1 TaxID=3322121 RepID=UPI003DA78277